MVLENSVWFSRILRRGSRMGRWGLDPGTEKGQVLTLELTVDGASQQRRGRLPH